MLALAGVKRAGQGLQSELVKIHTHKKKTVHYSFLNRKCLV